MPPQAPEGAQFTLPRPGRVLKAVMLAGFALWLAFAIGINWGGADPATFLYLCGNTDKILHGQIWRLVTAPWMHLPQGPGAIGHILTFLLGLFFLAPSLEETWGQWRFLRFLLFAAVFAFLVQMIASWLLPASVSAKLVSEYWFGSLAMIDAVAVAWAMSFRGQTVRLMFVLPVSSGVLILFVLGLNVLYLIVQAEKPEGLIAPFGGMLYGWMMGGAQSPLRRLLLRTRLKRLERELAAETKAKKQRIARSGLRVIEGDGRDDDDDGPPSDPRLLN